MSFKLTTFDSVTLPAYAFRVQSDVPAISRAMRTVGGHYDAGGTAATDIQLPYNLTWSALVYDADGVSDVGIALDALRAKIGTRGWLVADPMNAAAADRRALARLVNVRYNHDYSHRKTQPYDLIFEIQSIWYGTLIGGAWTGATHRFDSGIYYDAAGATTLNASPKTVTVTNGGNYRLDNAGITITCGATAAITAITIGISGICEFTYSGTIATTKICYIDCGSNTVTNDGTDDYDNLALTSNHVINPWLRLASGSNSVVVTLTGGSTNSTIQFTSADGWA